MCAHNHDASSNTGKQEPQSVHGSDTNQCREGTAMRGKKKQPNVELIKKNVATLDECFVAFTTALSTLSVLLSE